MRRQLLPQDTMPLYLGVRTVAPLGRDGTPTLDASTAFIGQLGAVAAWVSRPFRVAAPSIISPFIAAQPTERTVDRSAPPSPSTTSIASTSGAQRKAPGALIGV